MAEDDGQEKLLKNALFSRLSGDLLSEPKTCLNLLFLSLKFHFFRAFHLQAQQKQDIPSRLCYCFTCECMCLCVCVVLFLFFFGSFCDVMVVSSGGCLFGLLSLYLLSSSGRGKENPMVPCVYK